MPNATPSILMTTTGLPDLPPVTRAGSLCPALYVSPCDFRRLVAGSDGLPLAWPSPPAVEVNALVDVLVGLAGDELVASHLAVGREN